MPTLITREVDAKAKLLPDGWTWYNNGEGPVVPRLVGGRWKDALIQIPSGTTTAAAKESLIKALVFVAIDSYVTFRAAEFQSSRTGSIPTLVFIKPMVSTSLGDYAGNTFEEKYKTWLKTQNWLNIFGWTTSDGVFIPPGHITLNGKLLKCIRCLHVKPGLVTDPGNAEVMYCSRCIRVCPGDGTGMCTTPIFDSPFRGCTVHFPRTNCPECKAEVEVSELGEWEGDKYCGICLATICQRCKKVGAAKGAAPLRDGKEYYTLCPKCLPAVKDWVAQDRNEIVVLEKPCKMQLSDHPMRPIRLSSIEMEITSGANTILADLHKKRLTKSEALATHWQGDDSDFCYMEHDSSLPVDGGELIVSKIRMDDKVSAEKLAEAIGVVRKRVKAGDAAIDLRTGLHYHVDVHNTGFNHIRNLVLLHNFLEDPIYRLAAANYTRHRGVYYAMVLPKQGMDSQADFNRLFFQNNEHHSVLNVAYYYQAVGRGCECGSIVAGLPDDCKCRMGKCTVEFRVFNGTSSWKKIHAYAALCQSMVAWARSVDNAYVGDFPPSLYNAVAIVDDKVTDDWNMRLTWMFENLWFSEEERASLNYCIDNSELSKIPYGKRMALRKVQFKGRKYVASKPPVKEKQVNPFSVPRARPRYGDFIRPAQRGQPQRAYITSPATEWMSTPVVEFPDFEEVT